MSALEKPVTDATPLLHPLTDLQREHAFEPLRVDGEIPAELRGTLYRNGPSKFTDIGAAHWFDGMGAITAVRLDGQRAEGAVRLVHTEGVDADLAAATPKQGAYRYPSSWWNRLKTLFGGRGFKNLANINVMWWQQRLLALYEGTPPVGIDPDSLASLGEDTLGGVVHAFQAHPHRVPERRATYNTGLRIGRKVQLDVFELPDEGRARKLTSIDLPGAMEVHDFAASRDHLIIVLAPVWASPLKVVAIGSFERALTFHPDQPTRVLIVPIDDPERLQQFEAPPFFFFHAANGFADGDRLTVDLVRYPDFGISDRVDRLANGQTEQSYSGADLTRVTVDTRAGDVRLETLYDAPTEFPWVHPGRQSVRHRYVWAGCYGDDRRSGWWSHLMRLDTETGDRALYDPGPHRAIGEPVIVERSEREQDVWVLAMVRDLEADASHLAIFDGERTGDGPVARCWFDQALPHSLHGTWVAR